MIFNSLLLFRELMLSACSLWADGFTVWEITAFSAPPDQFLISGLYSVSGLLCSKLEWYSSVCVSQSVARFTAILAGKTDLHYKKN